MRKPEARIYQHVLQSEGFSAHDAVFFDDNADNIEGANRLGSPVSVSSIKRPFLTISRRCYAKNVQQQASIIRVPYETG